MNPSIIFSEKGKQLLLLNKYKYGFQKCLKSGEKRWTCTKKTCKSFLLTLGEVDNNIVVTKHIQEHSHDADIEKLHRQIASTSCKRKAIEDMSEKPAKVIRRVLQENLPSTVTTVDVACIRRNLYNARRKEQPALPKSIEDCFRILEEITIETCKGEPFMLTNSKIDKIVVFSCKSNIQCFEKVTRIYLDGTFNYCAQFFCQLFTIHGYYNGHYIPLIFSLLPDKQTETYLKLFNLIMDSFKNNHIKVDILEVVIDFEKGIHKAVQQTWPLAKIIGCRFHLSQSWYRKIQEYGLTSSYKDGSSEIGKWLRMTFALTFLKPVEVSDCFVFDLLSIAPDLENIQKYSDYLIDNYVSESSLFPPHLWAVDSAELTRTTNACESFHKHFSDSFYKAHPNIFVFIEKLKEFQTETYVKLQSVHLTAKIHNANVKNRQRFIAKMIQSYKKNEISRIHFIKCISFHCGVRD